MPDGPPDLASLLTLNDNEEQFRRLREQLATDIGVVPFVGAGLSIPCGMPGWERFLITQGQRCGIERQISGLLKKGGFEEAAEALAKALTTRGLADRLESRFGPKPDNPSLIRGPVVHLPELARGPVVTTNFDRILEQVFDGVGYRFEEILSGPKPDLLAKALYANSHFLVKLHGDVADRFDRVLTLSEYKKHYGSTNVARVDLTRPLPKLLRQLFTSRTLLFIGCSRSICSGVSRRKMARRRRTSPSSNVPARATA